jgi:hypothetical protein
MPTRDAWPPNETPWDEADEADGSDDWDAADDATAPCPYCRQLIFEDAERCPYCERYITDLDAPTQRKPWWIIAGFLASFYAIYLWIFG